MREAVPVPARLMVLATLREALALLPRGIVPYLLLVLAGLGLGLLITLPMALLLALVRQTLETEASNSGVGDRVLKALPVVNEILSKVIAGFVGLRLLVTQYRLAAEIRAGIRPRVLEVFARSGPPLRALLPLVLVLAAGGLLGLSALVIPGVFFLLAFGQALPAMVFEGTNVRGSLALSLELTRGSRLKILGLALVLMPFALAPSLLSYLVSRADGPHASLVVVLPTLAVALVLLFLMSCLVSLTVVIVYQDLRARWDSVVSAAAMLEGDGASE